MKKVFFLICSWIACMIVSEVLSFRPCKQAVPLKPVYEQKFNEPKDNKAGTIIIAWKMPDEIKKIVTRDDNFFKTMILKSYETETWHYFTAITIKDDPLFNKKTQEAVIDTAIKQLEVLAPYLKGNAVMMKIVVEYEAKTIEADQQEYFNDALKSNSLTFQRFLNEHLMKHGFKAASFAFKKIDQRESKKKGFVSTKIKVRHQINIIVEQQK